MSWWRKIVGSGAGSAPAPSSISSGSHGPESLVAFVPFERIIEAEELRPRHLRRDLLLIVEQFVLPGMLYANHPHISEILSPDCSDGQRFVHCFSHAMNQGEEQGLWTEGQVDDDTLFAGFNRYIRHIRVEHIQVPGHDVTVVTLPQPVSPSEGVFAFLCRNQQQDRADCRRYYMSEMARDANHPFLCSRMPDSSHRNFGALADNSLSSALARVEGLLRE